MENIVNAIILKDNKLLTIKRKIDPWPGMYGLPGGHIEEEENRIESLKRELKEEIGLEIKVNGSDFLGIETLRHESREFKIFFYKAEIVGGEEKSQKEEVEEIKWFGFDDFVQNLKEFKFSPDYIKRISNIAKLGGCHS
ncbi:MAG: NUDIX hydrolase [Candidatus Nealsonbacteria bacterium]|nr:NUDIX hydrolase [Candidatus Nealsonbacteria bacterium]